MLRNIGVITLSVAVMSGCGVSTENQRSVTDGEPARVISVIDGDTIETDLGRVRLIGIDAPERDECGYADATLRLHELVQGQEVVLIRDSIQSNTDDYGRLLRYVEIESEDVAEILIEENFVEVFSWLGGDRVKKYQQVVVTGETLRNCTSQEL